MNKSNIKLRTLEFEIEIDTKLQVIEIENILGEFYGSKKLIFLDKVDSSADLKYILYKMKGGDKTCTFLK